MWILLEVCGNLKELIEQDITAVGIPNAVTTNNSTSFKYKLSYFKNPRATGVLNIVKIAVPIKYLSNFFRSLEMPLINCKIHLELKWRKKCVMSSIAGVTAFPITSIKLYVPIVTL